MIMHGFREEKVVKSLSGTKYVVIPIDKNMTDTVIDKEINFSEVMTNVEREIEEYRTQIVMRDISTCAYYATASISEILQKLTDMTKTAVVEFEKLKLEPKEESISSLKKQIKNCKNPMQLKELNQKLNAAYKKRKRKKQ